MKPTRRTALVSLAFATLLAGAVAPALAHDGPHGPPDRHGRDDHRGPDIRRGAGPRHDMMRGAYLGREYRTQRYVVNDWRRHRLAAPPRGHRWVQAGNDFVLVANASNLIVSIVLR